MADTPDILTPEPLSAYGAALVRHLQEQLAARDQTIAEHHCGIPLAFGVTEYVDHLSTQLKERDRTIAGLEALLASTETKRLENFQRVRELEAAAKWAVEVINVWLGEFIVDCRSEIGTDFLSARNRLQVALSPPPPPEIPATPLPTPPPAGELPAYKKQHLSNYAIPPKPVEVEAKPGSGIADVRECPRCNAPAAPPSDARGWVRVEMVETLSDEYCDICKEDVGPGSHYHCANCGDVCSMMGHYGTEAYTCQKKTEPAAARKGEGEGAGK